MKKKRNIKNKKNNNVKWILISSISVLLLVILIVILICCFSKKKEVNSLDVTRIITIGNVKEKYNLVDGDIIKDYETFRNTFSSDKISEKDFEENNYVIVVVEYDGCSERDIEIDSYTIDGNNLNITFSYTAGCGLCAPEYLYYFVPVAKNIEKINVNSKYESRNKPNCPRDVAYKPIIYLYPEEEMNVVVKLGNSERITTSYPKYDGLWEVLAKPNGDLVDKRTGRYYYGLYWEGKDYNTSVSDEGFVVKGKDSLEFLEEKLEILGLTEREADEFIIYWLPKLEKNKYNYIKFESLEKINNYMPLSINPIPDTIIRVYMSYKPLDEKIDVKEQQLKHVSRKGFTVVEWGGTIID